MKKTWCLKLTGVVRVRVCEKGVAEGEVVNQSQVLEPVLFGELMDERIE